MSDYDNSDSDYEDEKKSEEKLEEGRSITVRGVVSRVGSKYKSDKVLDDEDNFITVVKKDDLDSIMAKVRVYTRADSLFLADGKGSGKVMVVPFSKERFNSLWDSNNLVSIFVSLEDLTTQKKSAKKKQSVKLPDCGIDPSESQTLINCQCLDKCSFLLIPSDQGRAFYALQLMIMEKFSIDPRDPSVWDVNIVNMKTGFELTSELLCNEGYERKFYSGGGTQYLRLDVSYDPSQRVDLGKMSCRRPQLIKGMTERYRQFLVWVKDVHDAFVQRFYKEIQESYRNKMVTHEYFHKVSNGVFVSHRTEIDMVEATIKNVDNAIVDEFTDKEVRSFESYVYDMDSGEDLALIDNFLLAPESIPSREDLKRVESKPKTNQVSPAPSGLKSKLQTVQIKTSRKRPRKQFGPVFGGPKPEEGPMQQPPMQQLPMQQLPMQQPPMQLCQFENPDVPYVIVKDFPPFTSGDTVVVDGTRVNDRFCRYVKPAEPANANADYVKIYLHFLTTMDNFRRLNNLG